MKSSTLSDRRSCEEASEFGTGFLLPLSLGLLLCVAFGISSVLHWVLLTTWQVFGK